MHSKGTQRLVIKNWNAKSRILYCD